MAHPAEPHNPAGDLGAGDDGDEPLNGPGAAPRRRLVVRRGPAEDLPLHNLLRLLAGAGARDPVDAGSHEGLITSLKRSGMLTRCVGEAQEEHSKTHTRRTSLDRGYFCVSRGVQATARHTGPPAATHKPPTQAPRSMQAPVRRHRGPFVHHPPCVRCCSSAAVRP